MTSGSEHVSAPLDHSNLPSITVKSKKRKGKITLEDMQPYFSRNTTLVDAAAGFEVSRSTLKRRMKELGIDEWPSNRKGNPHHSVKKMNHETDSASITESLQVNSTDCSDQPDQTRASEYSGGTNQLMLIDSPMDDAISPVTTGNVKKTNVASLGQTCSDYADVVTNVIGEARSCMTLHNVEAEHSDAITLVSPGGRHHLPPESERAPSRKNKEANKKLSEELIKSLMDEGISQEAAAKRLNVSLATLKRYRKNHALGVWPSKRTRFNADLATGNKPSPLDSTTSAGTIHQEVSLSVSTINATQCQSCQVNGGVLETTSVEAPDGRSSILVVKATYKDDIIRFDFSSTSSLAKLKEEVVRRLPLEENKIKIKYEDEYKEWVLLACQDDLEVCVRLSMSSKSNLIRLMILDL